MYLGTSSHKRTILSLCLYKPMCLFFFFCVAQKELFTTKSPYSSFSNNESEWWPQLPSKILILILTTSLTLSDLEHLKCFGAHWLPFTFTEWITAQAFCFSLNVPQKKEKSYRFGKTWRFGKVNDDHLNFFGIQCF